jgi:ParB family transcriptional regulator, chromosome partitioning protein
MIAVADVQVEDRHRSDLGDLESLAESLRELGQLQPIVVTGDLRLIAGGRRLAAARSLGWAEIEAKVASDLRDAASLLRAERDENTCRKPFTPTEEHSLYEALLASQGYSGNESSGQVSRADAIPDRTGPSSRDKQSAAAIVTGSAGRHKTLEKVGEVKRLAEDPGRSDRLRQKARDALAEMDRTGNIAGPHASVMLAARADEARNATDIQAYSALVL